MSMADMAKSGYAQRIPKDTVIFHENDQGAEMYIVLQGSVEISLNSEGKKIKLAEITVGGFFGEMSLLENQRRTATAVTSCDCVVLIVTKGNFDDVIAKNPQIAIKIMKGLSSRIRELNNRLKSTVAGQPQNSSAASNEAGSASNASEAEIEGADTEVKTDQHFQYLLHRNTTCPICENTFKTQVVKESKLKQTKRTGELRVLYEDVDPLYYNVFICPQCCFATRHEEFEKVDDPSKKKIAAVTAERKQRHKPDFNKSKTIGFILKTYEIAIDCYESVGKRSLDERIAGLWLNLSWLYDDLEKKELAEEARLQALNKYKNAYLTGSGSGEQDHKMEYLIGKLSLDRGELKEAREYLFKAATRRDGHTLLKQMARDCLDILKQSE
ncbi:MAG: DUF2225 domain-containing protein [Eubacteriales bacterium]